MLNKSFFMANVNDATVSLLPEVMRIYPSPESIRTRLRLEMAWNMWEKKTVDETLHDITLRTGRTIFGVYFQSPATRDPLKAMKEGT
ncbi:hypothetical protein BaRGS_00015990 [Batillaria attramentaria]|uniref:Uncharacterized protein n=1 Tax=Batillaria attramentaria TaxID=370345 RepID=A0ABD0L1C0_9CAEN